MAFVHLKTPDGEKEEYFSTLDDLFNKLKAMEVSADAVDPKDPAKKRKVESMHNQYIITMVTGGTRKAEDGTTYPIIRDQLELNITVKPIK